jgi:hypothetical protein
MTNVVEKVQKYGTAPMKKKQLTLDGSSKSMKTIWDM